jgi:hypothetical protein
VGGHRISDARTSALLVASGLPESGTLTLKIFPRVIDLNAVLLQKAIESIAIFNPQNQTRFRLTDSPLPERF